MVKVITGEPTKTNKLGSYELTDSGPIAKEPTGYQPWHSTCV